jgi:tyrosine-specific transport protein
MKDDKLIPGSVLGGMLLVSGSCIGAGMLALPVMTGLVGFFPSLLLYLVFWAFMTYCGLLLVEVNGWFYKQVNIVSMAETSFGKPGKIISWILYLFLFYSLLVAYISGSGNIFSNFLMQLFGWNVSAQDISVGFVIVLGIVVYFGTKPVDVCNRILMAGLIVAYVGLIIFGISKINSGYLKHTNLKYIFVPMSVLVTSYGYHNMIPSIVAYMKGDLKRVRTTIIGGGIIALIVYLLWNTLILGVVPFHGEYGLLDSYNVSREAAEALSFFVKSPWVIKFAQAFAFFAIVTSFLAQSLGLTHFIADGLKVMPTRKNAWWLSLLALVPPLLFALSYKQIFFKALSFAGGFCAVLLFCILPALMAWIGRYQKKLTSSYHVRGGKTALVIIFIFSFVILSRQLFFTFYK